MMDRYLFTDILEHRDYIDWKTLINETNREYHDRYYYGKKRYDYYTSEVIRCKRCSCILWNWRRSDVPIGSCIYNNHKGLMKCHDDDDNMMVLIGVKLSKNYRL